MVMSLYDKYVHVVEKLKSIVLLGIRGVLAYGFYGPAMMKAKDVSSITEWFESMGMPFPALNAYLSTITEVMGFVLLALGLGMRIITIPLIIVMIVAITTVHIENGFNASDNGFEIPLYYILMLLTLLVYGSGKLSLDYLIDKKIAR